MDYKIVRTENAGVFAGYIKEKDIVNRRIVMKNARRIWYWAGAASLSQLATDGTSKPDQCKFPKEVSEIELFQVIEILNTTEVAESSIKGVKEWSER